MKYCDDGRHDFKVSVIKGYLAPATASLRRDSEKKSEAVFHIDQNHYWQGQNQSKYVSPLFTSRVKQWGKV